MKRPKSRILITGGAGFIGANAADYFLAAGHPVTLLDNLSRRGTEANVKWLRSKWGGKVRFVKGDIVSDRSRINRLVSRSDAVLHLAAQVAVTLSVSDPVHDFLTNAQGTLHVLEAIRHSSNRPLLIFASTNKVHGPMEQAPVVLTSAGYRFAKYPRGIAETHPLDFHSPYGCSKGAAEQYVRDYARIYGMPTVVFRQSCIYGPHQFGIEDQGWVAWFAIRALLGRPITIYGDGHQVRDVLYVDDLVRLYERALENPERVHGQIYSVGGGRGNVASVLGAITAIEKLLKTKIAYSFADWRPGDQRVYISDITKVGRNLNWQPSVSFSEGLTKMLEWLRANESALLKYVPR